MVCLDCLGTHLCREYRGINNHTAGLKNNSTTSLLGNYGTVCALGCLTLGDIMEIIEEMFSGFPCDVIWLLCLNSW